LPLEFVYNIVLREQQICVWEEGSVNSRFEKMVEKLGTEEDEQHEEHEASARTGLTSIQSLFTNFVMCNTSGVIVAN
jgi:hypothetical protein